MDSASAASFRRDAKVIGLVAAAHCLSHFLQLTLPPLFVFLRRDFDVSYAALGGIMSVFYVTSGLSQFAAGFAVDRFGARPLLVAGTTVLAGGILAAGALPGFVWFYPLAAVMGIGNGVFHPADFAILNARVAPARLGYAFSTHGVGGSIGYALAPLLAYALGSAVGWRAATVIIGTASLGVLLVLVRNGRTLSTDGLRRADSRAATPSLSMFRQSAILLCFVFFCLYTTGSVAIQTFAAPALHAAYDISMSIATSAVTAYLLGSTAGIVAGGVLASRTMHHDRVAAIGLATGASALALCAAFPIKPEWVLPLFVVGGFALGSTGPSRDMIVRKATPQGASGRTYGFVYSGFDLGATLGPVLAGSLIDAGAPRLVFAAIAFFLVLALGTVLQAERARPVAAVATRAGD